MLRRKYTNTKIYGEKAQLTASTLALLSASFNWSKKASSLVSQHADLLDLIEMMELYDLIELEIKSGYLKFTFGSPESAAINIGRHDYLEESAASCIRLVNFENHSEKFLYLKTLFDPVLANQDRFLRKGCTLAQTKTKLRKLEREIEQVLGTSTALVLLLIRSNKNNV